MLCTVEPVVDLAELEASWMDTAPAPVVPRPRQVDRTNLDLVVAAAVEGDPLAAEEIGRAHV